MKPLISLSGEIKDNFFTNLEERDMNERKVKRNLLIVAALLASCVVVLLMNISQRSPEKISTTNRIEKTLKKVEKVLDPVQPGDMVVASNRMQGLMVIASSGFDGTFFYGYQPIVGSESHKVHVNAFVRVLGEDESGSLIVVPKKNVEAALNAMFGMAVNFQN
ncbi:MAG: hypothetical protein Q7T51_00925 [Candidatus Moranbacteria bacterium]|nr:hypothetical protein [Candidatus Moranbacteria bacterium]